MSVDPKSAEFQAAVRAAVASELERQQQQRPMQSPLRPGSSERVGMMREFDPRSGQERNSTIRAWLHNGQVVERDGVRYGYTQEFVGERAIRSALRPVLSGDGQVVSQGWVPADRETARMLGHGVWMDEDLILTDEKRLALEARPPQRTSRPAGWAEAKYGVGA